MSEDAVLCVTELSTNAILHSRTPFTVAVRRLEDGVRIDVQDERPDRLPSPVPVRGLDPLEIGITGRGLKLIAALASRWGWFNTHVAKTVWVELAEGVPLGAVEPIVQLAGRPAELDGAITVSYLDVPVRVAVASGVQVDDLVRQIQLDPGRLDEEEQATFYHLLERSASPRLIGRHEAFLAAGRGRDRFGFEVALSPDEAAAIFELSAFLQGVVERAVIQPVEVGPQVEAMRVWLVQEYTAQRDGAAPAAYPG